MRGGVFKIYVEPESTNKRVVSLRYNYDETQSPIEGCA